MRPQVTITVLCGLVIAAHAGQYHVRLLTLPTNSGESTVYSINNSGRVTGGARNNSISDGNRATWWNADGTYGQATNPLSKAAIGGPGEDMAFMNWVGFDLVGVDVRLSSGTTVSVARASGNAFGFVRYGADGPLYYGTDEKKMYRWDPVNGSTFVTSFAEVAGDPGVYVSSEGRIAATYSAGNWYNSTAIVGSTRETLNDFYIQAVGPGNRFLGYGLGRRAGIWIPGQGFTPLTTPAGTWIYPNGMNAVGTIVGHRSVFASDVLTGFIKTGDNPYVDFGTVSNIASFGATSYTLNHINDNGVIAGHMRFGDINRAFIAIPVPEPAGPLTLVVGLLLVTRRRLGQ